MTAIVLLHGFCSCIQHMMVMTKLAQAAHCNVYCGMCCTKFPTIRLVLMAENMTSFVYDLCDWQACRSTMTKAPAYKGVRYSSTACMCLTLCSSVIAKHVCQHCCILSKKKNLSLQLLVLSRTCIFSNEKPACVFVAWQQLFVFGDIANRATFAAMRCTQPFASGWRSNNTI